MVFFVIIETPTRGPTRSPLGSLLSGYSLRRQVAIIVFLVRHAAVVESACLRFAKTCRDGRVLSNHEESLQCVEPCVFIFVRPL